MRVVLFTETFLPKMDGIVRVVCLLADHLQARGHEVLIVAPQLSAEAVTDYHGMRVLTVGGIPIPWYQELRITPPSRRVYRALRDFQPDVAHFFHPVTIGLPGFLMAKRLGIPTLMSYHLNFAELAKHFTFLGLNIGLISPLINLATRRFFNWADYALAPSRAVRDHMQAIGIADVGLWKRGVDAERFHPRYADPATRHRISDGHPERLLLLYVGRLSAEKRIQDLRPLLDHLPDAHLVLVGDGPHRAAYERTFAGTATTFTGHIDGDELARIYASADIFVFPSSLETFGLVVTEAMAAGLPVVAAQVGGIPDVVDEGVTGYTFPIGDVATLRAGVQRLADDRAHRQAMGRAARAYAATQTWAHMNDEVIDHYRRIASLIATATR